MKTNETAPNRLNGLCLPDEIFICFEPFETDIKKTDLDILQNQSGRNLVKKMAGHFLHAEETKIFTVKNEKPEVYCGEKEISASFSHTSDGVSGAISIDFNVGCDMEHADRTVHSRLVDRMKHDDELASLYDQVEPIRIWTLKESALKMIGTGLRNPMKSVCVKNGKSNEFSVQFDNGKEAKICSFKHQSHWISVCYELFSNE